MSAPLPPSVTEPLGFEQVGLIAERLSDGSTRCNLHIIGGEAGQYVPPDWGRPSSAAFLLALTMWLRISQHPSPEQSPMQGHHTQHFLNLSISNIRLEDGTAVNTWACNLAKTFSRRYIENHPDRDSLTMSYSTVVHRYRDLMLETFPD